MGGSLYLAIPILLLLSTLQSAVLPLFPILGVVPQLPVLAALAWGLLRGPNEGVGWAFVAGLTLDLFSASPVGANSLALIAAVFITALVQASLPTNRYIFPVLLGGGGSLLFLYLYTVIVQLSGHPVSLSNTAVFPLQSILQGLLTLPVYWALYGLTRLFYNRRDIRLE